MCCCAICKVEGLSSTGFGELCMHRMSVCLIVRSICCGSCCSFSFFARKGCLWEEKRPSSSFVSRSVAQRLRPTRQAPSQPHTSAHPRPPGRFRHGLGTILLLTSSRAIARRKCNNSAEGEHDSQASQVPSQLQHTAAAAEELPPKVHHHHNPSYKNKPFDARSR